MTRPDPLNVLLLLCAALGLLFIGLAAYYGMQLAGVV
jgi:hypothetical protein